MKLGRFRWWLFERLQIVVVPHRRTISPGGRCVRLSSPRTVMLERLPQDPQASVAQIEAGAAGRAWRLCRLRTTAYYRVGEPLCGRVASGHWVYDPGQRHLTLRGIALVSVPGFPIDRALVAIKRSRAG